MFLHVTKPYQGINFLHEYFLKAAYLVGIAFKISTISTASKALQEVLDTH